MQGIDHSLSNLSLDQLQTAPVTKKGRRPNRAYHTFDTSHHGSPNSNAGRADVQSVDPYMKSSVSQLSNSNLATPTPAASGQFSVRDSPTLVTSHYVPKQRLDSQESFITRTFVTSQDSVPPCATTPFYCVDQNSSDPRKIGLTMYNIPKNEQIRSAVKLPVGAVIQPFAKSSPNDDVPQVSTAISGGPLRCRRCKAYVNPSFSFTFDSRAVCNFCKVSTQLDENYCAPLNPNGVRSDLYERPELMKGTVDFLVPEVYNSTPGKDNVPLHYVFLIDISTISNENRSSLAMVEGVRTCIEHISAKQPKCKIAIMAFDKQLRFFNLRKELNQAQEYIITDLQDVFLPLYNGLFVRPEDSMHVIQDTLSKITAYIEDSKFSHRFEACYGSALQAAKLAIDTVTEGQGGKILASLSTKPAHGIGNLRLRNEDALKKTLKCENNTYIKLGEDLLKSNVSLDLFCTGSAFMDLVSVAQPVKATSGFLKYYPNFQLERDEFSFVNDILHSVANTVGYNAQLKVRCSSGLSIFNYYSESVDNTDREPKIPVLHGDTTLNVLFKFDGQLASSADVHFQCAVLYTDLNGVRKVRILNAAAAASEDIHEVFKFVNQDAVVSIMVHDMLTTLADCDFTQKRNTIDQKVVDILTQYRGLVSGSSSSQLVLPESLKTLAAYMLSFEKSELMKNNNKSANGNSRVYDLFQWHTSHLPQMLYKLYPQILPLHELLQETDFTFYDENEILLQATASETMSVRTARRELIDGGCYLIFDGTTAFLWFNENTNSNLLEDLLNADVSTKHHEINLFGNTLPILDTIINVKARNVLQNWRQIVGRSYVPLISLRPHVDGYYAHTMASLLCEDKSIEMIENFDNYLVSLHKRIQEKLKKDDFTKPPHAKDHDNLSQKFIQF
ncbi:LANO_0B04742g1_1 [Lachancea nothofagi CBS 11611]|uniref:LANO_0B04742g1_1 n=1 Tax=Lachancea nothofagi CBS 11611 TaxID=1266666 RepID=A0A1G4IYG6_9SACH|nr:LANO_0B04742g1_1 [Lachancea nothofagi CBS 11611]